MYYTDVLREKLGAASVRVANARSLADDALDNDSKIEDVALYNPCLKYVCLAKWCKHKFAVEIKHYFKSVLCAIGLGARSESTLNMPRSTPPTQSSSFAAPSHYFSTRGASAGERRSAHSTIV